MKSDARVRYTKKVLKEALLKALREKPLKSITVKELCEAAEINRATFYLHYQNCYDLLEKIENEMLEAYSASLQRLNAMNTAALTRAVFDMIDANQELCEILIFHRADEGLAQKLLMLAHDLCIEQWKTVMRKATEEEVELLFSCLAAGIFHVVVTRYGQHDRATLINFVSETVRSCMAPYL